MSRARGSRGGAGRVHQHRAYDDYGDTYGSPRPRGDLGGRGQQQQLYGDRNRVAQSEGGQFRQCHYPYYWPPSIGRESAGGPQSAGGGDYRGPPRPPRAPYPGSYRGLPYQQPQSQPGYGYGYGYGSQQQQRSSSGARSQTEGGGGWGGGGGSRPRAPYTTAPPAAAPANPPPPAALLPAPTSAIVPAPIPAPAPAPAPASEEPEAPNNPHFLTPAFPQPPRTRTDSCSSWALMVEASCQAAEAVVGPLLEGALGELFGASWERELAGLSLPLPPFSAATCAELVARCKQLHERLPITIHKRVEAVDKAACLLAASPASLEPEDVAATHVAMKGLVQDCVKALRLPSLLGGGSRQFRAFTAELLPHAESTLLYFDMLMADCAEAVAARHQARLAAAGEGGAAAGETAAGAEEAAATEAAALTVAAVAAGTPA